MPDHVHLIVYDDSDEITMTHFTHSLKHPFAREVINRWRKLNAPILAKLKHGDRHRFWRTGGGYDRVVIRNELIEKIRYIMRIRFEKNLATNASEYRWSSARSAYEGLEYAGPTIRFDLLPLAKHEVT